MFQFCGVFFVCLFFSFSFFLGGVRFFFLFLNAVQATDDTFLKMKKKMKTIGMENAVTWKSDILHCQMGLCRVPTGKQLEDTYLKLSIRD